MSLARSVVAFLLVVSLSVTLVAGNVVTAADRTVMNEEFVSNTLEEEQAYSTVQSVAGDEAEKRVEEVQGEIPVPIDPKRAVNETLTRSYLQNQTEANLGRIFGYLRGDREDLRLRVNLTPVKHNVGALAETRLKELEVSELLDIVTANQDLSVSVQNVTFDLRIVANMSQGPESYQAARESFRDDVEQVVVNQAYEAASNDELLVLIGEDPRQYNESEKQAIVEERETEIKSELRTRDEINQTVDDQLATFSDSIESNVQQTVNSSLDPQYEPVAEPATEMLMVGVDGLTTNMTYQTFDSELRGAKANLADNVSTVVFSILDEEFPDQQVLFPNPDSETYPEPTANEQELLDNAKQGYGLVSLLSFVLPIVAILLVGLLYLVTRSVGKTAFGAGITFFSVGASWFAMATLAPGILESQVSDQLEGGEVPQDAIDLILGIFDHIFGAIAAQSLVVAFIGLVGLGIWLAIKLDLLGDEEEPAPEPEA